MKKLLTLSLTLIGVSQSLELRAEPLGKLNLSGALTGYVIYSDNKTDNKKTRYDIGSAIINLSKPAEPLGFTLYAGAYAMPVIGAPLLKTSNYTDLFSPLPIAYLELAPTKGFSLQAGKLPTLIGYESAFTYLNNYLQRGLIWNMQPVVHNGVRVIYTADLFTVKAGINDGFYTLSTKNPKPALEASITLTPTKEASVSLNILVPDEDAKPNDTANPSNRREFNIVSRYTIDRLSLGLDLMYVYAPKSSAAGVLQEAKASGGCIHLSYDLKPFKLSGRLEYVKDNSDAGGIDLVGLGNGNKGWSITFTPAYTKGSLFARTEFSYVKADRSFTINGKKEQTRVGIEVGFLF